MPAAAAPTRAAPAQPTPKAPAAPVAATAKTSGGGKGTRVNYSIGKPLQQLTTAVDDWLNKKGTFLAEESMTLARFCAIVDIPMPTFKKYVCKDEAKRQMVGCGVGGAHGTGTMLLPDTEQFVVDVLRRRDRANDGLGRRGGIQLVQDLQPELTAQQAASQFDRNVRAKHKEVLTGIVKAEATTTKRSAITVAQQYRWHAA
eukprot:7387342-Prymnesium_polylepis.1